jgi:hypothetical protein
MCEFGSWSCAAICSGFCAPLPCSDPTGDEDADGIGDACDRCPGIPGQFPDGDLDGVGDACDNCPSGGTDPTQTDSDADGLGDVCDAASGVILVGFEEPLVLAWGAREAFDTFNLYRGDLAVLRATGDYTQETGSNPIALRVCGIGGSSIADALELEPGTTAFYLVSGTLSGVESGLGVTSGGLLRPNTNPCAGP